MNDAMELDERDRGFSLVELLVVIVVLGILATVAVFAVRGVADRGETSACANDEKTVIHAMEARFADRGAYTDEATLASEGFLRNQSTLHDVTISGSNYDVVAVGSCAGAAAITTVAGPSGTTTTLAPSGPTLFPTAQFGSGSISLLILTYGVPPSLLSDIESDCTVLPNVTCTIVYTGNAVVRIDDLIANLNANPSVAYWDYTVEGPITIYEQDGVTPTTGPLSTLHALLVAAFGPAVISPAP